MTTVKVLKINNKIVSIECVGHTGYAEHGEDIVCSALSSIVQTAALGLLQVAKINVTLKIDEDKGYFFMTLPENISKERRHDADMILETLLLGVADLNQGFSDFIELEVN
ncbi:MAG: ribosomal-processing cysteine protease Prp [Clostridia bacterium]